MIGKEINLVKKNRKSLKVNIVNSFKSIFIYNPNIKKTSFPLTRNENQVEIRPLFSSNVENRKEKINKPFTFVL
jgi:hypothetical protein